MPHFQYLVWLVWPGSSCSVSYYTFFNGPWKVRNRTELKNQIYSFGGEGGGKGIPLQIQSSPPHPARERESLPVYAKRRFNVSVHIIWILEPETRTVLDPHLWENMQRMENFLLQSQLSVLTYFSIRFLKKQNKNPGHSDKSACGRLQLNAHPNVCGFA